MLLTPGVLTDVLGNVTRIKFPGLSGISGFVNVTLDLMEFMDSRFPKIICIAVSIRPGVLLTPGVLTDVFVNVTLDLMEFMDSGFPKIICIAVSIRTS